MKLKVKFNGKDEMMEIQGMNALDYYNVMTKFRLGQIDFKNYGADILKECIVSPVEARDIKYFDDKPKVLDVVLGKIAEISDVGLEKEVEIEIIEE